MYSLRYWYEQKHKDGKVVRLEIHKKNNSAAPLEIGDVVRGLSLNIEGGEDNIDAPIVSTSLVMTFVDAYDHHEAEAKKCGNWAEFYTPDATLWKVVLLCKDAGASAFRTLWGGYVTPDSYEEDLVYRGSVTIVARDNIGHLADFPFDAQGDDYGTISLRELLAEAWVKIESPMALRAYDDWMQTEGVSALDTRLNVSAFKDKSWHEAIEAALYAYGAAMRFIGDNEVMVSPLRYIANFGGSFTQSQPIFMAGATRMLTPAVKRIEETASYDLEAELQPLVKASDFSGERTAINSEADIYGYYLNNTEEGKGWLSSDYHTIFFDPSSYAILESDSVENFKNQMYVVADEDYAYTAEYSRYVLAQSARVKVAFGTGFMRKRYTDANGMPTGGYYLVPRTGTITKAYFKISVTQNGVKQYLKPNGEWVTTPNVISKENDSGLSEIEHDIDLSAYSGTILLKVEIGGINATIPYVGVASFSIGSNEAVSLLQTNRVNTNYNEENNVIIKRDPVIAPAYNTTILPSIIKNGIFYLDGVTYKPAKAWTWAGGTPQQMAVYNHLQLLTFYAKPNNVIEGNIVNGDVSRFAHIWQFEGKEHILVSGRYNYISGFIEGAILREFARYESLWGSTGEAQLPATETSEETNRESSASSSSASSTYDNTTVVNIGSGGGGGASNLNDLQDVDVTASVAGSVLYFNGTGWVDKTIHSLLAELKAIGDWFYKTDDGKSIGTKFNFFSEQEVSANGLSTGSNGGGGLISQVFGKSAFGTIATESNTATFNAYAIDSLYKRIVSLENKEVDLTGYATETWVAGQGFITSAALSPYMKTADANDTFATKTALNNLSSSHDSLATRVSTAEGNISTNAKGIADNKSNISANATAITNLGKRVTANEGNIAEILKWFAVDADGNLYTTYSLYSTKEISANGLSIGTGGGGGGLISQVYGTTAFGTIASESNSATFNAYAIDSLYKRIVSLEGKATAVSFVPALTSGKQIGTISIDGVSTILYGVDAYSKTEADGTFLKLSGGTISNGNFNPLTIKGNSTYSGIGFVRGTNSASYLVYEGGTNWTVTSENWAAGYRLIHSGNYSQYALPLSGGALLSSTIGCPLYLANTKEDWNVIGFKGKSHSDYAYLGLGGDGIFFVTTTGWTAAYGLIHTGNIDSYAVKLDGSTTMTGKLKMDTHAIEWGTALRLMPMSWANNALGWYDESTWHTIIHSGNIGSQSVEAAKKLVDNNGHSLFATYTERLAWSLGLTSYDAYIDGKTLNFRYGSSYATAMLINSSGNVTIGASDLASTTRKLFVGTASDNFSIASTGSAFINTTNTTGWERSFFIAQSGTRVFGIGAYGTASMEYGYIGSSYDKGLMYFKGENVGIGTNAPEHKLHVNGNVAAIAGDATPRSFRAVNTNGTISLLSSTNRGVYDSTKERWLIVTDGNNSWLPAGNVGIGASANEYHKLYVHGNIYADGNIALSSRILAKSGVFCSYESTCGAYMEAGADGTYAGIYTCNNGAWQSSNIYLHNNGNVTINKHLNVNSSTNLKSTLSVTGAVTMDSSLNVGTVINVGSNIMPKTTETSYLGSTSLRFLAVCAKIGDFSGAVTMSSTLSVGGSINLSTVGSVANNNVGYMQGGTTLMRYNGAEYGNLILSGSGGAMYFRPNGTTNTQGEMTLDGNGILKVMGRIEANAGVKVASGQALTFLDASGVEHKLTYDSTAGAFKFDGNILVLGDGQFNAIN